MRNLMEIRARIAFQLEDEEEQLMIASCAQNLHPLSHFLKELYRKEYQHLITPLTEEEVLKTMKEYMPFAIHKAHEKKGLSSMRSVWKFKQWLWVLEKERILENVPYGPYGLPILQVICSEFEFAFSEEGWR